jgi:septal ring factor EnvC (AmiA/AmiB activator)
LVTAAKAVQEHERNITDLEDKIAELTIKAADKAAKLLTQREQFARVLMSLERLARFPPEAMIAQPTSPSDTVRSAILLRSVVPEIERRAERLRQQIESLEKSRVQLNEQQASLRQNNQDLATQSETLGGFMTRNKLLKAETDAEQKLAMRRVEKLAREAGDLRDLISRLQEEQREREAREELQRAAKRKSGSSLIETTQAAVPAPPPPPEQSTVFSGVPISTLLGQLPFPAVGGVVGRYGENNENGMTRRGIEIATRPAVRATLDH